MNKHIPLDPSFIFEYTRLNNKAILLINKQLAVVHCSKDATLLLKRLYGLDIQTGYCFLQNSSVFENEVTRLVQQSITDSLPATAEISSDIAETSVNFIELHAYSLHNAKSKEPLVLLELAEEPAIDFSSHRQIKQVGEILNRLGDYVWIHNVLVNETWFSGHFNSFIGYFGEELKPNERPAVWWHSTNPDDVQLLKDSDQRYKSGEQTRHCLEYRITDRSGKERWVLDKGTVIQWQQDNRHPAVIIGTHTDITAMKQLQLEMQQLKEQKDKELLMAAFSLAEDDRKFIAGFLNENINQLLSAALVKLNAGEKDSDCKIHSEVQQILQQTIEEIKAVCDQIDSSLLEMLELNEVLNDIAHFIQTRSGKKIKLQYNDTRSEKRKQYEAELALARLFRDFVQYSAGASTADELFAAVNYTSSSLQMHIHFYDPLYKPQPYLDRKNVKLLVRHCNDLNGNFRLTQSEAGELLMAVELHYNVMNAMVTGKYN